MDGSMDYRAKPKRERQVSSAIAYMWNLKYDTKKINKIKYDTNEHIYKTETDPET